MLNLYTHLNQDLLPDGSLGPTVEVKSLLGKDEHKSVDLRLESTQGYSLLFYYPTTVEPINLNTPINIRSNKSLRSTVKIKSYQVLVNDQVPQSRRVEYEPDQDLSTNIKVFNFEHMGRMDHISNLPNRKGYCSLVSNPTVLESNSPELPLYTNFQINSILPFPNEVFQGKTIVRASSGIPLNYTYSEGKIKNVDWSNLVNPNILSRVYLHDSSSGLIPSGKLDTSMETKSIVDIGLALLKASANKQDDIVISILKALLDLASRWKFIIEGSQGQLSLPNIFLGFPSTFDFRLKSAPYKSNVLDNAFLGLSICRALVYLQDRFPVESIKLYGLDFNFNDKLKYLVLYLQKYCAQAVSLRTWWSCDSIEFGQANSERSLSASFCSSLFFSDALAIVYDSGVHYKAARLKYRLSQVNTVDSPQYQLFNDFYTKSSEDTLTSEQIKTLGLLQSSVFRQLWSIQQDSSDVILENFNYIKLYRDTFQNYGINYSIEFLDVLISYCYRISKDYFNIGVTVPSWVNNLINTPAPLSLLPQTLKSIVSDNFLLFSLYPFDCLEVSAVGMVSYFHSELKRMWPYGYAWMSEEAENSISSKLGSVLFAQAQVTLDWCLSYLVGRSHNLRELQGPSLRYRALNLIPASLVCSDSFARQYLINYLTPRPTSISEFIDQLSATEGITCIFKPKTPLPFSLGTGQSWYSYSEENQIFNPLDVASEQYLSMSYRDRYPRANDNFRANENIHISEPLGLEPRETSGFAYRIIRANNSDITASANIHISESISSTELAQAVYVQDGPVVLRPTKDFYPYIPLMTSDKITSSFESYTFNKFPCGMRVKLFLNFPQDFDISSYV